MAYGFQQLDGDGNVLVDSSSPFRRLTQVWDQELITLGAPFFPANPAASKFIYLPLVTSQWDLENNYLIERTSGGSFNFIVQNEETHLFTYAAAGWIIATFNGTCTIGGFFTPAQTVACGNGDSQTQVFNAFAIGKTF